MACPFGGQTSATQLTRPLAPSAPPSGTHRLRRIWVGAGLGIRRCRHGGCHGAHPPAVGAPRTSEASMQPACKQRAGRREKGKHSRVQL